jgi:hypothetical protein
MTLAAAPAPRAAAEPAAAPLRGHAPSRARLLAWLSAAPLLPDGAVLSWHNPAHPGYPYPEAAGLLLGLLSQEPGDQRALRDRIAARLCADISPRGAVGRAGVDYLFDSGIALHGLLLHRDHGGHLDDPLALDRLGEAILSDLRARAPRSPLAPAPQRWSDAYGCHLLKLILPLQRWRPGDPRVHDAIERLLHDLLPLWRGDRFVTHAASDRTYLHAHCYALEGLAALADPWRARTWPIVQAGAAWLADVQDHRGALPAWHDGHRPSGPHPADIIAQALRLWLLCQDMTPKTCFREQGLRGADPLRDSGDRALAALAARQRPSGGLTYLAPDDPERPDDLNTWSAVFAAQALAWAAGRREHSPWLI